MDHPRVERINPKGERGRFVCVYCNEIGTLGDLNKSECPDKHQSAGQHEEFIRAARGDWWDEEELSN